MKSIRNRVDDNDQEMKKDTEYIDPVQRKSNHRRLNYGLTLTVAAASAVLVSGAAAPLARAAAVPVLAAEVKGNENTETAEVRGNENTETAEMTSEEDIEAADGILNEATDEVSNKATADAEDEAAGKVRTFYPGAGFSYAFSAHKVSLQDVQEDCGAEQTTLTPVQTKEQNVVNAVSKTQGIQMNQATATILSATAVTVVSDANIAVQLAQMADRRQAQMKLDQGVITAEEAEALLEATQANKALSENMDQATISITEGTEEGTDSASAGNSAAATDSDGNELVVAQVNGYINVRADADTDAEIVGKLYDGSVAKVLGRTGNGWARIKSGDVTGYIREEYVATGETAQQLVDSVATKQAVVTTQTLRVRAAAQADSDVITLIGEGETLEILAEENGWYKVSTSDGDGYISSDFADVEEIYPEAISKEQEEAEAAAAAASEKAEEEARKAEEAAKNSQNTSSKGTGSKKSTSSSPSSNALNTYTGSSSSGSSQGQAVANYALQFVGNPYVWGGTSLTNGADCSGFTMAVYANFGVSLPHYTGSQQQCGTAVASLAEAQPGDLILYSGHVAIYLGNNQIVHASNPRYGITTGTATYRNIVAIRRIFN